LGQLKKETQSLLSPPEDLDLLESKSQRCLLLELSSSQQETLEIIPMQRCLEPPWPLLMSLELSLSFSLAILMLPLLKSFKPFSPLELIQYSKASIEPVELDLMIGPIWLSELEESMLAKLSMPFPKLIFFVFGMEFCDD
jgi:hypothetical protein